MTKFIIIAGIVLIAFYVLSRYLEKKSLYFPIREVVTKPGDLGMDYQEVQIESEAGVLLSAWHFDHKHKQTILFCHGNGGNISHRMDKAMQLVKLGFNVLLFDYRGYGQSTGSPTENGLYTDGLAAYNYLNQTLKIDAASIVIYGESLGGAIAIHLAKALPIAGLITEDTFTSIPDMCKKIYPLVPAALIHAKYNSLSKMPQIIVPKLLFHSQDDEIVPFYMGEALAAAAKEPKQFVVLHGSHNTAFMDAHERWADAIAAFKEKL